MANIDKEQEKWPMEQRSPEVQKLWLAAQQGNVDAQFKLGNAYHKNKVGFHRYNREDAVYWYRKAAEQGYSKALLYLGIQQAEKDTDEPIHWLCQLAVNSIIENEDYDELVLSDIDDDKAIASLRDIAEQGLSVAQTVLAYLYKTGHGVNQNQQQALFWFENAAQQQDIVAQYWLGEMYFKELQQFEKAQEYFQKASKNPHDGDYDELDITKIKSQAKDKWLLLQGIEQERKARQEVEDLMAMFAHKFLGPLQSIEYLEKDERILEDVRAMGNLLNVFTLVSTDAEKLCHKLLQDMVGESTLLSVLEQALVISLKAMLTLNNREKIRQHYLNYAKKTEQVPATTTHRRWYLNYLGLEKQLQADWQHSLMEMTHEPCLEKITTWMAERFFPVEVSGFANAPIHFERHSATESVLLIVISEIFTNALKYYASETQQAVQLHWTYDAYFCFVKCLNPSNEDEQFDDSKGSGKGHKFLSIIARKLGGHFPTPPLVDDYVTQLSIPTKLLMEKNV